MRHLEGGAVLVAFGEGDLARDIREISKVVRLQRAVTLLAIRVEINEPVVANFQRAGALGILLRDEPGHAFPGAERCLAERAAQSEALAGIIFADQNIIIAVAREKGVDHTEAGIQKQLCR